MRLRIWSLALVAVWALPVGALAASFGTTSSAHVTPFGDDPTGAQALQTIVDTLPADTAASLTDGISSADVVTPFGANHAAAFAGPGAIARAASLWSETFTITSLYGASGAEAIGYQLHVGGSVDAGHAIGGHAQIQLHAFVGVDANAQNGLLPNVVLDSAQFVLDEACGFDWTEGPPPLCEAPPSADGILGLDAHFTYGVPFRFAVLLEALAENGGRAESGAGGWLAGIALPAGAVLTAASGRDYSNVCATVPEPGTLLLMTLGLAAVAVRRAPRR